MAEKGHFGEGKKGFVILAPFCHPRASGDPGAQLSILDSPRLGEENDN